MVHQALLRNSFILILVAGFFGCNANTQKNPVNIPMLLFNKNEQQFTMRNGLLLINSKLFSGSLFTLFPNSNDTAAIENYLNGKEHGEWKKFYPSNKRKEKRYFIHGQKSGEYIAWWENGNRQLQYSFAADEYQGTCKEWNEAGMLTKVMNYQNGHENGSQQWWYNNGKVKANYIIKFGRRYGLLGTKNCINVSDSIFKK